METKKEILKLTSVILLLAILISFISQAQIPSTVEQTYSQRLGWQKNDKVIIFHVDDAGMSYDSNQGAIQALAFGIATSVSVMMPCPWVPGIVSYLLQNPHTDAGLHLTHTAEWKNYRWGPLTGTGSPGLKDPEGALWSTVDNVIKHASADEIESEIRAQLDRARKMGFNPTHLDTHMGTLWSSPEYLNRYIKVGIEEHIPILFSAGDNPFMAAFSNDEIRKTAQHIWDNGLPVVDQIHLASYDWARPSSMDRSDQKLRKFKVDKFKSFLLSAKPGIIMILIHCTDPSDSFVHISDSGDTRKGDLLAMTDPEFKKFITDNHIILTTWRELKEKRDHIK